MRTAVGREECSERVRDSAHGIRDRLRSPIRGEAKRNRLLERLASMGRSRHGAGLEEVQNLAQILLVLVFGLADVPPPLPGVPDFHAVVEAHQHDFLFLIDLDDLAEPAWDQNCLRPTCRLQTPRNA